MPPTQGTEQFQDAVSASKPATEKRRSLRTETHTNGSLSKKGNREKHEDYSIEVPPGGSMKPKRGILPLNRI